MSALTALARLTLFGTAAGGLEEPLPSGTRSLLLRFESGVMDAPTVTFGAVVTPTVVDSLVPGDEAVIAELTFWMDEAEIFVVAGSTFEIWYGQVIGSGTILEVRRDRFAFGS